VLLRGVAPGEEEEDICLLFTRNGMDRFMLGWAGAGLVRGLSFGFATWSAAGLAGKLLLSLFSILFSISVLFSGLQFSI
jgi:hypothetical protein